MKKLSRNLARWVNASLITSDQMQKILNYENKKSSAGRPKWIMYGFLSLGICVICIGIISLIAANWEDIPGIIKLAMDFIILIVVAYVIYRFRDNEKGYVFDSLSLLFSFLCLATIGLISQVYHTGGELWQALAIWLVITIPLTHMTRKKLLPHMWILAFLFTVISWLVSDVSPWKYVSSGNHYGSIYGIFIAMPFLCLALSITFGRFNATKRYGEIFRLWSLLGCLFIAGAADVTYSVLGGSLEMKSMIPVCVLAAIGMILLFTISSYTLKQRIIISITAVLEAMILLPYNIMNSKDLRLAGDLIGAGFSIIIVMLLGFLFILEDRRKLFNIATLLIGLRFLIIYFQVFGSLATTGFGLIISGLLIIGVAFLWFKKRGKIVNWLGGIIK